ncbi:MAG: hypothetical protein KKH01_02135 [Firmicutes bacterium]|nr:hypothetical protein [Bacillota bacterium]
MEYSIKLDEKEKYCLHDSSVSNIEFINHKLIIHFKEGFWITDDNGKEVQQLNNCRTIYDFEIPEDEELNTLITTSYKNKEKEIPLIDFKKQLEAEVFEIGFEYKSSFRRGVLLIGSIGNLKCNIFIDYIELITYLADKMWKY